MKYRVVIGRAEVEKLFYDDIASSTSYNDRRVIIPMQHCVYSDIRPYTVFKYYFSFDISRITERIINKMLKVIKSEVASFNGVDTCLINFRVLGADTLTLEQVSYTVRSIDDKISDYINAENTEDFDKGLITTGWCAHNNALVPRGEYTIDIFLGLEKTPEDKLEDEKIWQMLKEYWDYKQSQAGSLF
jgi:hypothetical protein